MSQFQSINDKYIEEHLEENPTWGEFQDRVGSNHAETTVNSGSVVDHEQETITVDAERAIEEICEKHYVEFPDIEEVIKAGLRFFKKPLYGDFGYEDERRLKHVVAEYEADIRHYEIDIMYPGEREDLLQRAENNDRIDVIGF